MKNKNTAENGSATATKVVKYVKGNRKMREEMQRNGGTDSAIKSGVGVNNFGSFCSDGLNVDECTFVNAHAEGLDLMLTNMESSTAFHVTESEKHGVHAGKCEVFRGVTLGDGESARTVDVLRKTVASSGQRVYYTQDCCKGFALVSDAELLAIAGEKRDLRQFRQKIRGVDGSFADGEIVKGALLRAGLAKDFNALVYRTSEGLDVRVLMTRKAKEHETEFFQQFATLKTEESDALAAEIFEGVKVKKAKDDTRNAARRARAAAVKAAAVEAAKAASKAARTAKAATAK